MIKLDIFIVSTGCCASSDKDDGDKVIPKFKPKQTQVKQSSKGIQRKRPLRVKPQGLEQVIFFYGISKTYFITYFGEKKSENCASDVTLEDEISNLVLTW